MLNGASAAELKREAIRLRHEDAAPAARSTKLRRGRDHARTRSLRVVGGGPLGAGAQPWRITAPAAQGDDREGRERPAHHHRLAAAAAHRRRAARRCRCRRSRRADTKQLCYSVLTDAQKHRFEEDNELDLSFGVQRLSRFRANVFMQRGAVAGAFRAIPYKILTLRGARPAAGRREICAASRAAWCWSPARPARASRRRSRR